MWKLFYLIVFSLYLSNNYFKKIYCRSIIKISKYQLNKLKENINSLNLNANIFGNKQRKNKEDIIIDDISEINSNYSNLLDLTFSYEGWLTRFSQEYHLNNFKNTDLIKLLRIINSEFELFKIRFNKFGENLDLFIDNIISHKVDKNIRDDKLSRHKLKKQIIDFNGQLMKLNLDMEQLRGYQHKLINSSSLYVIKLDNNLNNSKNEESGILEEKVVDMRNENNLYDLWIYYEHNHLPDLKDKIKFISSTLLLFMRQIRLISEILLNCQEKIKFQYLNFFENNYMNIKLNLRYNVLESKINSMFLDNNLLQCLVDENVDIKYLLSDKNIDGINMSFYLNKITIIIQNLTKILENKSFEFQKNLDIISNLNMFIVNGLEVNISNINSFFFSSNNHLKKYIFSQLNYQINQLNTISEYIQSLELNLKHYYHNFIPCYFTTISNYFKIIFNNLFNIYKDLNQNISDYGKYNITITDRMINFMFNVSEVAKSMNNTRDSQSFPTFGTKYNFNSIFNNYDILPISQPVNINDINLLIDKYFKNYDFTMNNTEIVKTG